jgi:hypothetical protein
MAYSILMKHATIYIKANELAAKGVGDTFLKVTYGAESFFGEGLLMCDISKGGGVCGFT